ncbi:ATP-binding protein [Pseudonocardia sulfidoxydans]
MVEKIEDRALVPEISRRGYVVSLGRNAKADFPTEHRGARIEVLTAADLTAVGFTSLRCDGAQSREPLQDTAATPTPTPPPVATPVPPPAAPRARRPSPRPRTPEPTPPPAVVETPGSVETTAELAPVAPASARTPDPAEAELEGPQPVREPTQVPEVVEVSLGADAHAEDVRWRISTSGSPHLFVLGIPGQGKSVTTRRILNSFADQGLPALVVDFHGDMAASPAGGAAVLDASLGLPISPFEIDDPARYREASWELAEVIGYVCGLGEIQRNTVYEGVRAVYEQRGFPNPASPENWPTMDELADAVRTSEAGGRSRNTIARLRPLSDFGVFADGPHGSGFADLLRRGVVIDVHGLMEQVQRAAGAFVLRKVYREMFRWGQTSQLRLAVVLDEAQRLARGVTLPKIMKEGRKYGVAVVVASQGVEDFHQDVLGNAGTKVAFRCNFPQSRKVAGFLRGRSGQDMSAALEDLAVGQAYISTPDHGAARKVFMARD